jgi:carboxymethylenebutenolidase
MDSPRWRPALFDHIEHHVELGYDEAGVRLRPADGGEARLRPRRRRRRAAQRLLQPDGNVGVVGYCWGGTVAYLVWARLRLPAVSYYGARTAPFLGTNAPMRH